MTEQHDWQTVRDALTPELRRQALMDCAGRCVICGTRLKPHIDHIVPVSLGGQSILENLWVLCARHNTEKGAQWPTYWLVEMLEERDDIRQFNLNKQSGYLPKAEYKSPIMCQNAWKHDNDRPLLLRWIDTAIAATIKNMNELPDEAQTTAWLDEHFDGYQTNDNDDDCSP
jgi:hypothetical protein